MNETFQQRIKVQINMQEPVVFFYPNHKLTENMKKLQQQQKKEKFNSSSWE